MTDVILGDCVTVMSEMDADSFDAIVTDPPYGLEFMGKEWDRLGNHLAAEANPASERSEGNAGGNVNGPRATSAASAMRGAGFHAPKDEGRTFTNASGHMYDNLKSLPRFGPSRAMQEWHHRWATEALRVAKPGAHLLAFGGTRTYHRLTCALEDAGWEIRDCLVYAYASGFPKSHNLDRSEAFCRCERAEVIPPEHDLRHVRNGDVPRAEGTSGGQGPVLFPGLSESDVPTAPNRAVEVTVRVSEPGVEGRGDVLQDARQLRRGAVRQGAGVGATDGPEGRVHHGAPAGDGNVARATADQDGSSEPSRPQPSEQRPDEPGTLADERRSQTWRGWTVCDRCGKPEIPRGLGTALKPAWEPIVLARKPLTGTVAANVTRYSTGALNIDATRIGTGEGGDRNGEASASTRYGGNGIGFQPMPGVRGGDAAGRWPPNLLLTDAELFDVRNDGVVGSGSTVQSSPFPPHDGSPQITPFSAGTHPGYGDTGGYARFFLVPKASRSDREPGMVPDGHQRGQRSNVHPTTKPVDLMRHLVRLVTPPGGRILDPFLGSGTTAIAAIMEGFSCVGIEREPEYVAIAEARLNGVQQGIGL